MLGVPTAVLTMTLYTAKTLIANAVKLLLLSL